MARSFNPPPAWPRPPRGWSPPPGWEPEPSWGPAPPGWRFWTDDDAPAPALHGAGSWPGAGAGAHGVPAPPVPGGGRPGPRRRPRRVLLGVVGLLVLGAAGAALAGTLGEDRLDAAVGTGWTAPGDPVEPGAVPGPAPAVELEIPEGALEIGTPRAVDVRRGEGDEDFELPRPDGADRPVLASTLRVGSAFVWFEGQDEDGGLSEVTPVPGPGQEAVFLIDDHRDSPRTERMEPQAQGGDAWEFRVHDLDDLTTVDEVRAVTGTGARVFRWRAGPAHVVASAAGEDNFVVTAHRVRAGDDDPGDLLVNEIGAVERATTLPDADVWVTVETDGPWMIVPQDGPAAG